jgi:hypothetical protein
MNAATARQLDLIAEIGAALDAGSFEWWLFGGWAMDFHVGRVTRDHSDIEVFVWLDDAAGVREALTARGFLSPQGLHPDEGQPFLKDGQEAGITYLAHDAVGGVVTPGRWADWPWPHGSFEGPRRRIGDLEAPVISVIGLLDMKENFARHPHGAPRRAKDEADIATLRRLLDGAR